MAAEAVARPSPAVDASAIIAEDEETLRDELCGHLAVLWPGLRIVATAADGVDALALFERHRPQVMFLDIQMPGLTGLEVARQVQEQCHLVFITAYDAHAIAAFEAGALDYLLKPYGADRLAETVRRLQGRIHSGHPPVRSTRPKAPAQSLGPRSMPDLDQGFGGGSRGKADHGVGRLLLPRGCEIHDGRDRRTGADHPPTDQGSRRRTGPQSLLADPSLHPSECLRHQLGGSRPGRRNGPQTQGPTGTPFGQRRRAPPSSGT